MIDRLPVLTLWANYGKVISESIRFYKKGVVRTAPFSYTDPIEHDPIGSGSHSAVDYIAPDKIPYYQDCEPLVSGLGYGLVELTVFKKNAAWQVKIVITGPEGVGIADCTKVHRAILPRLEALLNSQDMYVEVTSPGLDRVLKNAAEFPLFTGKGVKVWDATVSDWVSGTVVSSDSQQVILRTENGEKAFAFANISKAKLAGTR